MANVKETQKADLRARILRSALHEFTANGYRGATIKNIADGAGASVGVVMKYFGSKEELFCSIMEKYTLTDIFVNCKSTEPYDIFSIYLDYLRKVQSEDPEHFDFCSNVFLTTALPKEFSDRLFKEFWGSPIEKAIVESQRRNELPACDPLDLYRLFFKMATSMMKSYAYFGIHDADNDAILSTISYKPANPDTEKIIQEIKSDRALLLSAVEKAYPFSVNCNVTGNLYHVITNDYCSGPKVETRGTYDELIEAITDAIPDPEQKERFRTLFDRQNVIDAYNRGERELGMLHMQSRSPDEERWMRTKGVLSQAPNGDIVLLSIAGPLSDDYRIEYELQKSKEENEIAQLILSKFAGYYTSVFILNPDTAAYEILKADPNFIEETRNYSYAEQVERFVRYDVDPAFRELMGNELSIGRIRERVLEENDYVLDFRRGKAGDTHWEQMRVRPLTRDKIAIGLLNTDERVIRAKTQEVLYNQYVAVYLLDLDNGLFTVQKKPAAVGELETGGRYKWSDAIRAFAERATADTAGDIEIFGDTEKLRGRLTEKGRAECLYKLPGRELWRKIIAEPYEYGNGAAVKAVICIRELENSESEKIDLTERVIAQQKEIGLAYEREKRANESKTEFLRQMTHDIMTPLNHIKGMTYIAQKNIEDKEKVLESLRNIDSAEESLQLMAEKALRIIDPDNPLSDIGSLKLSDLLRQKRILIVDDNRMNREILADVLNEQGIDTEEAENGAYAIRMLLEKGIDHYDAVLMDIDMPVMNGYVATRAIRKMYPDAALPIIAVSANSSFADRQQSKEAGMDAHLAKPLDIGKLKEALKNVGKA